MLIDYGQGEREIAVSILTLMIYEQEFGGDMLKDLFGRVEIREDDLVDAGTTFTFDYTTYNWTAATKALWACLKTADDSVPSFRTWASQVGDVNLYKAWLQLMPEVSRRLFRTGATDSE